MSRRQAKPSPATGLVPEKLGRFWFIEADSAASVGKRTLIKLADIAAVQERENGEYNPGYKGPVTMIRLKGTSDHRPGQALWIRAAYDDVKAAMRKRT